MTTNPAVQVKISDGRTIDLRLPNRSGVNVFLRAVPSAQIVGRMLSALSSDPAVKATAGDDPNLDDANMQRIDQMIVLSTGLPLGEVEQLSIFDWLSLAVAIFEIVPSNFLASKTESVLEPSPQT